jgi:thiamine biosynthesis lipoprotein
MKSSSARVSRARPLLGTLVEIRLPSGCGDTGGAMAAAFAAVARVHQLMSAHDPDSDVSRINRMTPGRPIGIDAWTYDVLARAKTIHAATAGLFDCAVASALMALGYLPNHGRKPAAAGNGTLADLELLEGCTVVLRRPLALTLDGIAKGYAVDRAVESLRGAGIAAGVVNAGGDLRMFGDHAGAVHLRDPGSPGRFIRIDGVRDAAVASSALYFGNSPLVDPRTGEVPDTVLGVTVFASDCTTADALTKPCLLAPARAREIAEAFGARAMVIGPQGVLH